MLGDQRPDPAAGRSPAAARSPPPPRRPGPAPHPEHRPGSCRITASGRPVISSVAPGCPFGRPGLRPDLPRSDFGAGLAGPSRDGGFEEFRGVLPQPGAQRRRPPPPAPPPEPAARPAVPDRVRSAAISMSLASTTCAQPGVGRAQRGSPSGSGGTSGTNQYQTTAGTR